MKNTSLETIACRALEIPETKRREFIANACDNDPEQIERVLCLLEDLQVVDKEGFLLGSKFQNLNAVHKNAADVPCLQRNHSSDSENTETADFSSDKYTIESQDLAPPRDADDVVERIGRYEIRKILGDGGFGRVYEAYDPDMDRIVALKSPNENFFEKGIDIDEFVKEALNAGKLDHPRIVPIYDVQKHDRLPFIVQKLIDGGDLLTWMKSNRTNEKQVAELIIDIADGIAYAHKHLLYHRDLKPANILLDKFGRAYIADFGLALRASVQKKLPSSVQGTLPYMSPEQTRGETHRMDGRTDIWSIGVIMYELLTGTRPFQGKTQSSVFNAIQHDDPKRLRELSHSTSPELERICLKCLEKRRSDRYIALDLLDDLRCWYDNQTKDSVLKQAPQMMHSSIPHDTAKTHETDRDTLPAIVPKGLRSFDLHDASFFMRLLPGPYDRNGIPESINFWKRRIEASNVGDAFTVGVIYGPSGCGKSSLVKAGLLPHLDPAVQVVRIEAQPVGTEERLLLELSKLLTDTGDDPPLPAVMSRLRDRPNKDAKILFVIDQFEQWLHAQQSGQFTSLLDALRHCDGQHVQCILVVRDDFWMSMIRFMHELDVPLREDLNSRAVDLFSVKHAISVLTKFGQSYGDVDEPPTTEQLDFIRNAVEQLATDGKVICLRLALFAQMMHGRAWDRRDARSIDELGVAFLEETFSGTTAQPEHRLHERAARAILAALLPETSSSLKGATQNAKQLVERAGYAAKPRDSQVVLSFLDRELRLIIPIDVEGTPANSEDENSHASHLDDNPHQLYQLTHDYLVPSLRVWLTRKQRETRRGRAELRLSESTEVWARSQQSKFLPSMLDTARIAFYTRQENWSRAERRLMNSAAKYYLICLFSLILFSAAMSVMVLSYRNAVVRERATRREALKTGEQARTLARNAIDTWLTGPFEDLRYIPGVERPMIESLEQAEHEYKSLISKVEDDRILAMELGRTLMRKAMVYETLEKWPKAIVALNDARSIFASLSTISEQDPSLNIELATADLKIGRIRQLEGNFNDAAIRFESAKSQLHQSQGSGRDHARQRHALGSILYFQSELMNSSDEQGKMIRRALKEFAAAHAAEPNKTEYLTGVSAAQHALRRWHQDRGQLKEARQLCESAIENAERLAESDADALLAHELRGDAYLNLAHLERQGIDYESELNTCLKAIGDFEKLQKAAPQTNQYRRRHALAVMNLADVQRRVGETRDAAENMEFAASTLKSILEVTGSMRDRELYAIALDRVGYVHLVLGDPQKAVSSLRSSIELFEALVEESSTMGSNRDRYFERLAFSYLRFAQTSFPNDPSGCFPAAAQILEDLSKKHSTVPRFRESLAKIYTSWSEILEGEKLHEICRFAQENWVAVMSERPTPNQIQEYAWFLILGRDEAIRDADEALTLAHQLVQRAPTNPTCLALLGAAHYRAGEFGQSVDVLRPVVAKTNMPDIRAAFFWAMALQATGQVESAEQMAELAIEQMIRIRPGSRILQRLRVEVTDLLERDAN